MQVSAYEISNVSTDHESRVVSAHGKVVENSEVLKHHFPGFPVLPGVLMLDLLKSTVEKSRDLKLKITQMRRVRFSNYLKPGASWESQMSFVYSSPEGDLWDGEIFSEGVKMASARLTLCVQVKG